MSGAPLARAQTNDVCAETELPMIARQESEVARALAEYLGEGRTNALFQRLELRRDLGLEPLDLVLFVLEFEEAEGLSFSFELLERVTTVGELVTTVANWIRERARERLLERDEQAAVSA